MLAERYQVCSDPGEEFGEFRLSRGERCERAGAQNAVRIRTEQVVPVSGESYSPLQAHREVVPEVLPPR